MTDAKAPMIVLLAGLALMSMGQTVLFAIFGPLGRDMGLSELMIGGVISLSAIAVVVASPWWGRQSDRIGRKPVFVISALGLGLATLAFTAALEAGRAGWVTGLAAFALLAGTRMIYGLGVTGIQPAAAGWVADTTTAQERTGGMAMIGAAFGIGSILGPTLAWLLSGFDLLLPLYVIAVGGLIVAGFAWRFLPETRQQTERPTVSLSPLDPRLTATLATVVCVFSVIAGLQQTLAFYVQDIGQLTNVETARRVGQAFALLAAVLFATQILVAVRKPKPKRILLLGLILGAAGAAVLLALPTPPSILIAHAVLGLGMGLAVPGLQGLASIAVGEDEQGTVGGLVAAAMAGGFALGPLLGTALYG
ncbi:MAG: MFS transporter, partial [Pseudomonadota bacterium]